MTLARLWPAVALCAALVAAFAFGWRQGAQNEEARQAALLEAARGKAFENAERLSRVEADRLAAQKERDALSRELEEAAYADPDADRPALSADSVQRINRR
ncbi:MAG: hypothetical protein DI533_04730 [Cereibacter sphaeroides]|uniref:Uncharacterized protein n=1 Tax=Cereibacter sphaeroides TaxID=1063 RepID=A0A2W5SA93_CERSP|nr:MAG: hypothetical protein DI533_04730 [Cereibacter sphaeroides]